MQGKWILEKSELWKLEKRGAVIFEIEMWRRKRKEKDWKREE